MNLILNSKSFLHKIIDVTCFWSVRNIELQEDHWDLEKNAHCLPRYYRIKEIESLARAFGISKEKLDLNKLTKGIKDAKNHKRIREQLEHKSPLQFILDGDFLMETYNLEYYPDLLKKVTHYHAIFRSTITVPEAETMNVIRIYKLLLKFRQRIQTEIGKANLLLEGKALEVSFVNYLKSTLNLDFIDDILAPLLDPKSLEYTRQELILSYGYPDVDLRQIDFRYYMDSYEDF